jgi:hypothetical protein
MGTFQEETFEVTGDIEISRLKNCQVKHCHQRRGDDLTEESDTIELIGLVYIDAEQL